jgi:cytochrome c3-like protein/doubled CXXCH motif protein
MGGKVTRMRRTFETISVLLISAIAVATAQTKNSCLDCHSNLPEPLGVSAEIFAQNIHAQKGLGCVACHGGDPSKDDSDKAMSRAAGWTGRIDRHRIPELCASCHSNAERMKKYNPGLRVDQFQQYRTSVHGVRWAKGDPKVAVCTDCHGIHDLRAPSDPRSKVHPINIATTCARCHADAEYMKPYGIKTDQFAKYQQSVHYQAMVVRDDLSAPTCTTCHGNHGAAPPGVADVTSVCSNCHVFQAQLFDTSPHKLAFANMNLPGCVTCHSNHQIQHPTDEMIGTGPKAICLECHSEGDAGFQQAAAISRDLAALSSSLNSADEILGRAQREGMEVSQPLQQQSNARDALMKARVSVHAFRETAVKPDTDAGLAITKTTFAAGTQAMKEWKYRRVGLGLSLFTIALTLVGLRLCIRNMEKK